MAFVSGPVSFQRFFISGPFPSEVDDECIKSLQGGAFGRQGPLPDDTQLGWVGPEHLFETDIVAEQVAFGAFLHLAFRIDKLGVPANVLKSYVRMEEQSMLEVAGKEFLNRAERRKAKDAARVRAEQEARAGGFRRISAYPVLIDLRHRTVYLGTSGLSAGEAFMAHFGHTFGCSLEPADPERVALRLMQAAGNVRALENLAPSQLVSPPKGYRADGGELGAGGLDFLGKELLTWLWYQTDRDEGMLKVRGGDEVAVMVDKTLRLKCDYGLTGTDVITADSPTTLPEARAALRTGKQPTRAGLVLGSPLGEFRLTLDGPRLVVSGLTVPEEELDDAWRVRCEQRFELIADAADLLDALFDLFLQSRTGSKWRDELRAMSAWASEDKGAGKALRVTSA